MRVIVNRCMSVLDVALQWCGSVDYAAEVAELNALPVDWVFAADAEVVVPEVNSQAAKKISNSGAVFCTNKDSDIWQELEGVMCFMQVRRYASDCRGRGLLI